MRRALWENRYFIAETTGGKIPMQWADGREVVYQDMMTEGYDNLRKKFFRTFIDNHFDTGVLVYEGSYDPANRSFTYLGEVDNPYGGKNKMYLRVTILDQDHYREELSAKGDNGWDTGVTKIEYTRLK